MNLERSAEKTSDLRRHLVLGTAIATGAFLGGYRGYIRPAFAACDPTGGGTYQCSGAETATQAIINVENAAVVTVPGFSVDTTGTGGNAITITGDGALSYTDASQSPLTAAGAALSIQSTGDIGGGNIGSITVQTNGALIGGSYGIFAYNQGTGAINIVANGNVTGTNESAIWVSDYSSGGNIN